MPSPSTTLPSSTALLDSPKEGTSAPKLRLVLLSSVSAQVVLCQITIYLCLVLLCDQNSFGRSKMVLV